MDFLILNGVATMGETVGSLNLKIARLERRLADLQQRERLSRPYPTHRAYIISEYLRLQGTLSQLVRYRQELTPH